MPAGGEIVNEIAQAMTRCGFAGNEHFRPMPGGKRDDDDAETQEDGGDVHGLMCGQVVLWRQDFPVLRRRAGKPDLLMPCNDSEIRP